MSRYGGQYSDADEQADAEGRKGVRQSLDALKNNDGCLSRLRDILLVVICWTTIIGALVSLWNIEGVR